MSGDAELSLDEKVLAAHIRAPARGNRKLERLIDAVNGDQISGGGAGGLAAVAGYPHLTVPMGDAKGLPVGLSFIGPKWSDGLMLSLGYSYEQARGPLPPPRFLPAIEANPARCSSHSIRTPAASRMRFTAGT